MKYFASRVLFCLFALTVPLAQEAWGQQIIPLLHCVRLEPETNTLDAFFGYYSAYTTTVHIDFGDNNFFYPGEPTRNQPTDFLPGMHENVFIMTYQPAIFQPELTWFLLGRSATAKADGRFSCDPPVGRQAWNSTTTYAANEVVSHNGFLWITPLAPDVPHHINREPGLSQNAGFWSLYAPKGVPGELGPKGDKGDRGDPGLSVLAQAEPAGNNCAYGGVKLTDSGGTRFVCNGAPGPLGRPPTSGLIGYWRFDENSGTTAADSSSNNNTGSLTSGASWSTGTSSAAVNLDGVNDYVQVGAQSSLVMSNALTMSAWIYPVGAGSHATYGGVLISKEGEYLIARFADGTIRWAFANSNRGWAFINTGYVAPPNEWTHVAVTYDNGLIKTYINGALIQTYQGAGSLGDYWPSQNDFRIGGRQAISENFQGLIDEARVYNRALSASEVATLTGGS